MKINPVEAMRNLDGGKTLSGADPGEQCFAWDALYQGHFYRKLLSLGYDSEVKFSKLFERMKTYEWSGEFVDRPRSELHEISMFGLILFDRIVRADAEKMSFADVFDLHEDLSLCLNYVMDIQKTSDHSRQNALARWRDDPKQKDKKMVKECWDEWQKTPLNLEGKPKYLGDTAFAKDMLTKSEYLESNAVITRWCRQWKNKTTTMPAE